MYMCCVHKTCICHASAELQTLAAATLEEACSVARSFEGGLLHHGFASCIVQRNIAIGRHAPNAPVELVRIIALIMKVNCP